MDEVLVKVLEEALHVVWSADTGAAPDWTASNRSKGQCAVTACVVQDYFGGDILHTTATLPNGDHVSHYFNVVDGDVVDLTREQFPTGTSFSEPAPKAKGLPSTRDYCLSYDSTRQRYDLLRSRVAAYLQGQQIGS
ncbi:YunG family protein [Nocardia colli]|uniref:YunG family protein n=1 Tax=Nocardia colli TaxID=2545717 RepID=UPI0035DD5FE0